MQDTSREKKQDTICEWRPALVLVWKGRRYEQARNTQPPSCDLSSCDLSSCDLPPVDDEDAYIHDEF